MEKYILSLDQGTTSSRAIVFDQKGSIRAVAQQEFRQIYPQDGWVEHDANEIWESQKTVMLDVLEKAGISSSSIAAVGITNQRETIVVWNRQTGEPLTNAIVWQDRRTAGDCDELRKQGLEPRITEKTGLRLDPYFSGTKLRWLLKNCEGALDAAAKGELAFGTMDTWLLWKLTHGKVHKTDVTNASRTLLLNIHTGQWDEELLEMLEIPESMLPEVCSSSEVFGQVDASILGEEIPIAGIAGDQQAALFGQACFEQGMAKNTYGTGCFLLMNTGNKPVVSKNNLLTTIAWKIGDETVYALEGSVFIAGAVIQWIRDELKMIESASEIDELAAEVEDNGGLYLVPAFAGLGAPYWDPYARGLLVGITRGSTKAHMARAALESIGFQSADLIECMEKDSGVSLSELRVDGGATKSDLLMQFQADLLGTKVLRPQVTETTALGAAYLAGLAVGYWENQAQIAQQWQTEKVFESKDRTDKIGTLKRRWKKAVGLSRGWLDAE
ncbi:MAG TPA: glycerol kinase GlpK [Verrucomicrobiales bacterium]|nr:glycerol kinase GlpK [Verrucomicrobiales bacterium]